MIYSLHTRRGGDVTPALFQRVCSLSCTRYIILPRVFVLADEINVILSALPPCGSESPSRFSRINNI